MSRNIEYPYLTTNDPAPISEVHKLHAEINEALDELRHVNIQKKELQIALDNLVRRLEEIEHFVSCRRGAVSLIRQFPNEIVEEIVIHTLGPLKQGYVAPVQPGCMTPHWTLGQICSRWRKIVLSLPIIWSNIIILAETLTRPAELLETVLERSKQFPLQLEIRAARPSSSRQLDTLLASSPTWRHVSLFGSFFDYAPSRCITDSIPLLESLTLYKPSARRLLDFSHAPQLRQVFLRCPLRPLPIRLPWSQLEHFTVDGYSSPQEEFQLLSKMSNLVSFSPVHWPASVALPDNFLQLNQLRRLHLNPSGVGILQCLLLPNLQEVEAWFDPDHVTALCSLIQRSSCTIASLTLHSGSRHYPLLLEHMKTLLQSLNTIQTLNIQSAWVSVAMLKHLAIHHAGPCLFSRLLNLSLEYAEDLPVDSLIEMLRSRRVTSGVHSSQLRSVAITLVHKDANRSALSERLQPLRDEGMHIVVAQR